MKAVILAGGLGSRLAEETDVRPKPMVEIGGKPILWHIMKLYAAQGVSEFIVCLGYKGYVIKEWFANVGLHGSDVTFDLEAGTMEVHRAVREPWRVTLVETGESTMTGGRLRRALPYVGEDTFCFTYGDGLADLDLAALLECHAANGRLATVTAVRPPARFGALAMTDDGEVSGFREKPVAEGGWINGGFFVLSPAVARYLTGDDDVWEQEPMRRLAAEGQLGAYRHTGFWQPMDTLREKQELERLWRSGAAPWKVWP